MLSGWGFTEHARVRYGSPTGPIIAALAYLLCHGAAIFAFPQANRSLSFSFLVAAPLLAGVACVQHGRLHGMARDKWNALGLGLLLWSAGMACTMADVLLRSKADVGTAAGLLLYVLYGVPLTYALASEAHEDRILRGLDAVMALALGGLFAAHTLVFSSLSNTDERGIAHLRLMFDIENAFIAVFALVRWLASDDLAARRFFRRLARFALAYLAVAAYINHFDTSLYGQLADVLIGVPFIVLIVDTLRLDHRVRVRRAPTGFARVVRVASPLILPAALLIVSGMVAPHDIGLAVAGFAVATLGYGARSVLVQLRASAEREQLDELARIDALTGLANRRWFDDALGTEWNRARRTGGWLSLVLIDIDHFKRLNDEWGHPAGDACLHRVARTLSACTTRAGDLVARYGGEEFAVILPGAGPDDAARIAEDMRRAVEGIEASPPAPPARMTVSAGVASIERAAASDASALVRAADGALYQAKREGRNRVVSRRTRESAAPAG